MNIMLSSRNKALCMLISAFACLPLLAGCDEAPVAEMRYDMVQANGEPLPEPESRAVFESAVTNARLMDDGTHCELARVLTNYGEHLLRRARPEEALQKFDEAVTIAGRNTPKVRSVYALALDGKVTALVELGRFDEALPTAEENARAHVAAFGTHNSITGQSYGLLADMYYHHHRLADAEASYRRALRILAESRGLKAKQTVCAMRALGECLQAEGRDSDARPYLKMAYSAIDAAYRKRISYR